MSRRERDDDGAILVLTVAVALLLFAIAALTVDISFDYGQRRQQQNAADSGALAGAKQLNTLLFSSGTPTVGATDPALVKSTALNAVTANGGDTKYFSCKLVYAPSTVSSTDCDNMNGYPDATSGYPVGVRVTAGAEHSSFFASAFGKNTLSSPTAAAARVAPVVSGLGPFMICTDTQTSPTDQTVNGHLYKTGDPLPNILNTTYTAVNPAAIGITYLIHDNTKALSGCNAKNSFDGGVEGSNPVTLPGPVVYATGDKAGPYRTAVSNLPSCTSANSDDNCAAVTPVCDGRATTDKKTMYCDLFAVFILTKKDSNTHWGKLTDVVVAGGGTGTQAPVYGQARVIQLTE